MVVSSYLFFCLGPYSEFTFLIPRLKILPTSGQHDRAVLGLRIPLMT